MNLNPGGTAAGHQKTQQKRESHEGFRVPADDTLRGMDRIFGHQTAKSHLMDAVAQGRVPHALLLVGPQGVGKTSLAIELAMLLGDPDAGPDLMGQWQADTTGQLRERMLEHRHPDLHLIRRVDLKHSRFRSLRDRKSVNLPIGYLRERLLGGEVEGKSFLGPVFFQRAEAKSKVFLIPEADRLQWEAANALLKVLEEPPEDTYILLGTRSTEAIPATIRSRVQTIRLRRLEPSDISSWAERCFDFESPHRGWVLERADGRPGRVLELSKLNLGAWREAIEASVEMIRSRRPDPTGVTKVIEAMQDHIDSTEKESKKKSDTHDVRDETVSKDGLNKDTFDLFLEFLEFEVVRMAFESPQEEIGVRESLAVARKWVQGTLNWKQAVEGLFTMTTRPELVSRG